MRWLVTAFAPFAGRPSNSSKILLEHVRQISAPWRSHVEFCAPLPVTFAGAWPETVRVGLKKFDGVLGLGQAENRSRLSIERVALNVVDTKTPDNDGVTPGLGPIDPLGPAARWSGIRWENLSPLLNVERSYSAGQYVCNAWLYQALAWAEACGKQAGFIHVPLLSSQTDAGLNDQDAAAMLSEILKFLVQA